MPASGSATTQTWGFPSPNLFKIMSAPSIAPFFLDSPYPVGQNDKDRLYFCDTTTPFRISVLPPPATILYTACIPPAFSVLSQTTY
jgi:hypothetical protein